MQPKSRDQNEIIHLLLSYGEHRHINPWLLPDSQLCIQSWAEHTQRTRSLNPDQAHIEVIDLLLTHSCTCSHNKSFIEHQPHATALDWGVWVCSLLSMQEAWTWFQERTCNNNHLAHHSCLHSAFPFSKHLPLHGVFNPYKTPGKTSYKCSHALPLHI